MYSYWHSTVTGTYNIQLLIQQSLGHDIQLLISHCHRDMVYSYWQSTVTETWYTSIDTALSQGHDIQLLIQQCVTGTNTATDIALSLGCVIYSYWHSNVTGLCIYSHWYNTVTGTWHTAIDTALSQGHIQQVTMQCHRDMTYSYWYRPVIRMCNIQLLTQHCYKGHHSHWYSTIILTGRHTAIDTALSRGATQLCSLSQKDPYNQRQISIWWCNIVTQTEGIYSDISQCHRHIQS